MKNVPLPVYHFWGPLHRSTEFPLVLSPKKQKSKPADEKKLSQNQN